MIFTGRLLANANGITFWEKPQDEGFALHIVRRGIVVDLDADELAALAHAATLAAENAQTPEAEKDRTRRLQILQARLTDFLKRERASHSHTSSSTSESTGR